MTLKLYNIKSGVSHPPWILLNFELHPLGFLKTRTPLTTLELLKRLLNRILDQNDYAFQLFQVLHVY